MTAPSPDAPLADAPHLGLSWSEAGLGPADLARAQAAIAPLAEELELARALAAHAPHTWAQAPSRAAGLPTLFLDDVSAIPFLVNIAGVEEYQHRARTRAGEGDLFAGVTPLVPGYEDYCREQLGLGRTSFLLAEPVEGPLAVARACASGSTVRELVSRAKAAGGLRIHPYMGIEAVWDLAAKVQRDSGAPVWVLGPPPPVTWVANDKALFSAAVTAVLGAEWVVETARQRDPDAMARTLLEMAPRHRRVGLKRTRCASGMGNVHFDLSGVRDLSAAAALVREFLTRTEWDGREEVLVVAWEETDLSPSTQLWIPPLGAGPPRLDGIYEQILAGPERVFVGSRPSGLGAALNLELGRASLEVGAALQALGYVGRCSFDLLVVGDPQGAHAVRFTECNGRWGGTSTPMHLVERTVCGRTCAEQGAPARRRPPYRAQDFVHRALVGATLPDILARLGDALFDPRTGQGRYLVYNVGPLAGSGKLDVIALGRTQDEAEEALLSGFAQALGL